MKIIHHANLFIGENDLEKIVFDKIEKDLNFKINGNPDFYIFKKDVFGISEARNLENWSINKPFSGDKKVSVIIAESITPEAQNAMLKTIEEPPVGTYFFVVLNSEANILSTFLSRVRVFRNLKFDDQKNIKIKTAEKYLNSNLSERLKLIKNLKGETGKKNTKDLILQMEKVAYQNIFETNKIEDLIKMKKMLISKKILSSRGSSSKMILEWLSVVL